MVSFLINKGVGKAIEFKGLRAQYVIYLVLGVLFSFVLFFFFSLLLGQIIGVITAIIFFFVTIGFCYYANNHFGEHGIVQLYAAKKTIRRIHNNKRVAASLKISISRK